jgi:hypothetical protein
VLRPSSMTTSYCSGDRSAALCGAGAEVAGLLSEVDALLEEEEFALPRRHREQPPRSAP